MEILFSKCKLAHAKRVLFFKPEDKKIPIGTSDLSRKEIEFLNKLFNSSLTSCSVNFIGNNSILYGDESRIIQHKIRIQNTTSGHQCL